LSFICECIWMWNIHIYFFTNPPPILLGKPTYLNYFCKINQPPKNYWKGNKYSYLLGV
jgi:hypothetical protein